MDYRLDDLVDQQRIVAVDATPVPAPPNSRYPGEHLLVNCHYGVEMAQKAPGALLDVARADAVEVMRRLAADPQTANYVSAVVTIYGHFPCPGAGRPARRRIYRLNILTRELLASGAELKADGLPGMHAEESSELEDIAELLHEAAH